MLKKLAIPMAVRLGILLVLVLAVLVTVALIANGPLASLNHQVADLPNFLMKPLGSWGS
jgi:hypothetical protein